MKNESGFIPSKYRQPDRYEQIGHNWAAVYKIGNEEFYVQLLSPLYQKEVAKAIILLHKNRFGYTGLNGKMSQYIKTYKKAMEYIEELYSALSEES